MQRLMPSNLRKILSILCISSLITSLIVACGEDSSDNALPIANAGVDQTVLVGSLVSLDASSSTDADNDALTYNWSITTKPSQSEAILENANSISASFTADIEGDYSISLIVNDGSENSTIDTVTINVVLLDESDADFYAPAAISQALLLSRTHTWSELTDTPENLMRFSFGSEQSNSLLAIEDDGYVINDELTEIEDLTAQSSATNDLLLRSMFQFIEEDGLFRITSTKHSNYSFDAHEDTLILRDTRSINNIDTNESGYLLFSLNGTSPMVLSATKRMEYDATNTSFVEDNTWTTKEILLSQGSLSLDASGTSFAFYHPPINFDIPFDFNPDEIERVENEEFAPDSKDDAISGTASKVTDEYADQVSAQGANDETDSAALLMLVSIQTTLESQGSQMRYPAEFYMAFRSGLFARTIESAEATDSTLGQATVPYVYFTNEADSEGVNHPFMVIASYGMPDSLALLWDVAKPPGDGAGGAYEEQSVTRSFHREGFLMKIPLRDYGQVSSLTENDMNNDLASDVGETNHTHHNYASVSATGVAIDGVIIYPSYNNTLHVAQTAAELSAHGMHSGRGLGVHYHADAHSAKDEGLNLYNSEDYEGHTHPPIVSIGFDGVAGYGVYLDSDNTSDGVDIALDSFGGHEHGDYGYHYHSFTQTETTEAGTKPDDPVGLVQYTKHMLPPLGAWAGRINDIPEFWDNTSPNYVGGNSVYLGTQ